ncbi:MAG: VOC family protein [Geminicoccaceae bacterium]
MNASFGIDHPLIAVNDIELLRDRMISLGFNMTAIGRHPWGTSTSLAMFEGCLIEIMGIHDESLLDEFPAGDFRFGRHVHTFLQEREGIALTALHSTDVMADAEHAEAAGFTVSGHLEFGRDVALPEGRAGRTRTTLALMPDARWPRLSFFLCQQHRPELIYVPEWLDHPNTVCGICGVTVLADNEDQKALMRKLEGLYGSAEEIAGGFSVGTANGPIRIRSKQAIENDFGTLQSVVTASNEPCIVAMDLRYNNEEELCRWIANSGLDHRTVGDMLTLVGSADTGNTFLRFRKSLRSEF